MDHRVEMMRPARASKKWLSFYSRDTCMFFVFLAVHVMRDQVVESLHYRRESYGNDVNKGFRGLRSSIQLRVPRTALQRSCPDLEN